MRKLGGLSPLGPLLVRSIEGCPNDAEMLVGLTVHMAEANSGQRRKVVLTFCPLPGMKSMWNVSISGC